mgnify:FL=1
MYIPTTTATTYSVIFVCMGNICRSPTAHGVFRHKLLHSGLMEQVSVDSAGTHNYHPGKAPDERTQRHAAQRGYDLSNLRARQVLPEDFERYDMVLAMDWDNLALLQELCPTRHAFKVRRMTEFCQQFDGPVVPDPYYGGVAGFEEVLDLVEDACEGLLRHVHKQLQWQAQTGAQAAAPRWPG